MLNHCTFMGRLCADPELRTTPKGIPVCSFRIAVERDYPDQSGERPTDFLDITAWRGIAEFVCNYFHKGRMIAVDGHVETSSWTDKYDQKRVNVEVVADNAYFADSKPQSKAQGKSTAEAA